MNLINRGVLTIDGYKIVVDLKRVDVKNSLKNKRTDVRAYARIIKRPKWKQAVHPETGKHPMTHRFATNDPKRPIVDIKDEKKKH